MSPQVLLIVLVLLVVLTLGRFAFIAAPKGPDWALEVAFIRLDFPPEHRGVAQQIAAGLAEVVGMRIKELTPEHNLAQIADWAENQIYARDLIQLFLVAFEVQCDESTTFRDLVERVFARRRRILQLSESA